eukprot:3659620-Ditylum_brightwellii.AAC.1
MNTQSNLAAGAEDVPLAEVTYILAKDSNYIPGLDEAEDLSDVVSMLSVDDDKFRYDSIVSAFKSVVRKERKLRSLAMSTAVMLPTRSNKEDGAHQHPLNGALWQRYLEEGRCKGDNKPKGTCHLVSHTCLPLIF